MEKERESSKHWAYEVCMFGRSDHGEGGGGEGGMSNEDSGCTYLVTENGSICNVKHKRREES